MADPVKISELPAISSVQPNDIVPVVDAALTQTSRCTASQIAELGGGPPGDNTVTTAKLANGAVTYPKIQNVTGDRVLGRTSGSSGTVQEITCTAFARDLLAAANGNAARALINDTPTFTGQVTVNGSIAVNGDQAVSGSVFLNAGTASRNAYSFVNDPNCGISQLGGSDTISLVTSGVERLRIMPNGEILSQITGFTPATLGVHGAVRAMVQFNGMTGQIAWSTNVTSITRVGVGNFSINYAQPLGDQNCAVACGQDRSSPGNWSNGSAVSLASVVESASTYCYLHCTIYASRSGFFNGDWVDSPRIWVAAFR